MRALCCAALLLTHATALHAQDAAAPVPLVDVPFISQSEALCGGAAAAMVLRYWGERGVSADSFAHLLDRSAAGIRTSALVAELRGRGWQATEMAGGEEHVRAELSRGRPVLALVEDRPAAFHYLVIVAWHDRGVVFHDPARAPFRVMTRAEFDRRWKAANRWMAIVGPGDVPPAGGPASPVDAVVAPESGSSCDRLMADGVRYAQANDLEAAERVLAAALPCPGPAAARELAGVRLLQQRWPEVVDLASAATAQDADDAYAWKLLATGRFVQDDRLGALEAWNRAGEPRLDLVRVDGLTRTRHRVVERTVGVGNGELLSPGRFTRARRRLSELPSAASSRLDYVPVPSGLAELRAVVAERPLAPRDRLAWTALGLATTATRQLRMTVGSLTGGGEELSASWRFWQARPRTGVRLRAPAPWGGVWSTEVFEERQPLTPPVVTRAHRTGGSLAWSDWATGRLRWEVAGGLDRWENLATFGRAAGGVRLASLDDRVDGRLHLNAWIGDGPFATIETSVRARSSTERLGTVLVVSGAVQRATAETPLDLWPAGDTGHARSTLTRAHPVLEDGRLRADRLGRTVVNASLETQRWWHAGGLRRVGGAAFADLTRTSDRLQGPPQGDVDVGVGVRIALAGMSGVLRVDLAKGLHDGRTALSFVLAP